ncbi:MAG: M23 peptidase protein [uncultured bacterium]|nr:MAG: M23 peptidase protein [uncultured bacterium]
MKKMSHLTIFLTLTLTLSAYAAEQNSQLNNLNNHIAAIKIDLQQATQKKSHLQSTLAEIETTEGHLNQQLKNTQQQLSQQQKQLQQLQQQSLPLSTQKKQARKLLQQQIRAAYLFSQQPYLKLWLAPDDMLQTQRLLLYFHYITQSQMQTVMQLQQSIAACEQNQKAIQTQYAQLLTIKQSQMENQTALQKTKTMREQLIATINQHIQSKHQKLISLLDDKKRLENTLQQLHQQITEHVSTAVLDNHPFATLQGKLSWPVRGQVLHNFGTQIDQSELRWDGTLIQAPTGQPVHAVASGRVIFAKWLAGYGLMIIINQGNGYMTLYGRNQTLTKNAGDTVRAGDVIATVGKSGGFHHSALYFSIRHNAQVLNPMLWCR